MSWFELRTEQINVRGREITVRELSHKQKLEWVKRVGEDSMRAPAALIALTVEPPISEAEAEEWPADVVEQVVDTARRLSGMRDQDAKNS